MSATRAVSSLKCNTIGQRGSHRQFKHATKLGRITVPGKPSDDLAPGTQSSILKQAGLKQRGPK
ncbi:MAG: addiction module toxin, HicA family [Lysobacterales bacterium CG02_land_8_20_14_3_00_62_12]|nr:MAG: addiction module toxin, HicA family [Xanthomonadales bacterium CG02_land_8_20_14_3_00_62_12]